MDVVIPRLDVHLAPWLGSTRGLEQKTQWAGSVGRGVHVGGVSAYFWHSQMTVLNPLPLSPDLASLLLPLHLRSSPLTCHIQKQQSGLSKQWM